MIRQANATRASIPAGAYIRMSLERQAESPAQQKDEIEELAAREGYRVVEWFKDEAISGDSGADERPRLADLLEAAKAGKFTVVLAWSTDRISRKDAMAGMAFYNELRDAGIDFVHTMQRRFDLRNFADILLLVVGQQAHHEYLIDLSLKVLRGFIADAKKGRVATGRAIYALDMGEFDEGGRLIRRLRKGDKITEGNHRRRILSEDPGKIEAVRYAFQRADSAYVSPHQLELELQAKGYPPQDAKAWSRQAVYRILTNAAYAGVNRWGAGSSARFFQTVGDEIVPRPNKDQGIRREKRMEESVMIPSAHPAIVPFDLFLRVYHKYWPEGIGALVMPATRIIP